LSTAPNGRKENILTSWKEIAAYLDRDVRTCVRWEQRYGLPVHRLERDSKAKVFAYREEIDRWLADRAALADSPAACELPARRWFRPFPLLFALAGLAAAGYFLFLGPGRRPSPGVPADFHLAGSTLIVVDKTGRELWRHDLRVPDLVEEGEYRGHSKKKEEGADYIPVWPHILIQDIDGDERLEVLFTIKTRSRLGEGALICFDDRGGERWRFEMGRALEFGGKPFHNEYRVHGFDIDDFDGDGRNEVLAVAFHLPDWPCQVVLLDTDGRLEGEYWNAGYIMDASAGDVDGDGARELILGGVNNEYRRGCLAVFEAGALRGGSPQTDASFRSPAIGEGGQTAYILFPKTEVHRLLQQEGDPVNNFRIREGNGLMAMTTVMLIYYDLDKTLACRGVTLSNAFRNYHEKFVEEGKQLPDPSPEYEKSLGRQLRYYRNGRWDVPPAADVARLARRRK
jgi:hypothetical protein